MSKTTGALAFSSTVHFYEIYKILDYCKKHSSEEIYSSVIKSFKKTIVSILIILFILITVFVAGIIHFDKEINSNVTTNNITYSHKKIGHIGNDILWYIDNIKHEVDVSDYGYNINDYEKGTDFYIYLDDNHKVVDISPIIKGQITASDKMDYWLVGSLIAMCVILVAFAIWIRYSKSKLNPGKEYFAYIKWLRNKSDNEECYPGYNNI